MELPLTTLQCFNVFLDKPDTLICGNCKEMFRNIVDIINHKRHYCKLRFACKCSSSPASLALLKEGKLINETEDNDKGKKMTISNLDSNNIFAIRYEIHISIISSFLRFRKYNFRSRWNRQ